MKIFPKKKTLTFRLSTSIKDELFDSVIIEFIFFSIFYTLFEQAKYLIILLNCKTLIFQMIK